MESNKQSKNNVIIKRLGGYFYISLTIIVGLSILFFNESLTTMQLQNGTKTDNALQGLWLFMLSMGFTFLLCPIYTIGFGVFVLKYPQKIDYYDNNVMINEKNKEFFSKITLISSFLLLIFIGTYIYWLYQQYLEPVKLFPSNSTLLKIQIIVWLLCFIIITLHKIYQIIKRYKIILKTND